MRIPGRYWWVSAFFTCAFAALAVVFPTLYMGDSISSQIRFGDFSSSMALFDAVMIFFFALIFLAGGVYPAYVSAWYLWGFRQRSAALRGASAPALLPAIAPIAVGATPNPADGALVLQWRRRPAPSFVKVFKALFMALQLGPALVIPVFVLLEIAQSPDRLPAIRSHLWQVIAILVCLLSYVVLIVITARMRSFQAKHAIGVTATTDGLECISQFGRRSFIHWAEARLFELDSTSKHDQMPMIYRLYSSQDVAEWALFTRADTFDRVLKPAHGIPIGEAAMASVILARTGLKPRTLRKYLALATPSLTGAIPTASPYPQ